MNQQKIAIITDSCADISEALLKKYNNIYIVPLRLTYQDGEYLDGVTITPDEVYRRLGEEIPKTSLPSGESVQNAFEQILQAGYEKVFAITFSSGLSGTYNMLRIMGDDFEGLEVAAFDTLSGSLGTGATVLQTAEYIRQGRSFEEIKRAIPHLIENTHVFFCIDTLEYLQKGGRIGKISAVAGTLLQIKPIISFAENGELVSVAKVRGRRQSMEKMVQMVCALVPEGAAYNLMAAHGNAPGELAEIRTAIQRELPRHNALWEGEIDCTLGTYVGPHLLGAGVQILPDHIFE